MQHFPSDAEIQAAMARQASAQPRTTPTRPLNKKSDFEVALEQWVKAKRN